MEKDYNVPNLEKGIMILEYLSVKPMGDTLQGIKLNIDISQTTAYRILNTLLKHQLLIYNEKTKHYKLSRKLLTLGYKALNEHSQLDIILPKLREIRDLVKETVCYGILGEQKGIFIEQAQGNHTFKFVLDPGKSFELHCSAPGKAILAFLPNNIREKYINEISFIKHTNHTIINIEQYLIELEEVKKNGYAIDNEEELIGVICIGVPIFDFKNYPCGAIWTSGPKGRLDKQTITKNAKILSEFSKIISYELGYIN